LRLVANDNLQARAVGSYGATQMVKTKFAVVDDGTVYGKGLANDSAKLLEGRKTVVIRQSFDWCARENWLQQASVYFGYRYDQDR
jgi:branched-chain amino acid transport system substrate-binding protein